MGGSRGREHVYLWLIHVDVWQKPTEFCEAIILKLKNQLKKKSIGGDKEEAGKTRAGPSCREQMNMVIVSHHPFSSFEFCYLSR